MTTHDDHDAEQARAQHDEQDGCDGCGQLVPNGQRCKCDPPQRLNPVCRHGVDIHGQCFWCEAW